MVFGIIYERALNARMSVEKKIPSFHHRQKIIKGGNTNGTGKPENENQT